MDGKFADRMNIRDKFIRIFSSAAIAGLTISFIVGEWVDYQSEKLGKVVVDNKIYPQKILPTIPIQSLLLKIPLASIKSSLEASNLVLEVETEKVVESKPLSLKVEPLLKMAPKDIMANVPKAVNTVTVDQMANVFDKIQTTQSALYKNKNKPLNAVITSRNFSAKDTNTRSSQSVVSDTEVNDQPKRNSDLAIVAGFEDTAPDMEESDRNILSGKIIPNTTEILSGHFEVSVFEKISPEGTPVGYPIGQEILKRGVTRYRLEIPNKYKTVFLFAQYFNNGEKNSWLHPERNPIHFKESALTADLYMKMEDSISSIAAVEKPKQNIKQNEKRYIKGRILTYFADENKPIPQSDVVVKVRGRKEAVRTNSYGNFSIPAGSFKGTIFLELLKNGYHPSIIEISDGDFSKVHEAYLLAKDTGAQVGRKIGINQNSQKGIYIGKIQDAYSEAIPGATVSLSVPAEGPYYFNENGIPSRDLRKTSSDGRFVFFNIESSLGFLEASVDGESIAPISLSIVDGGQFIFDKLKIGKTELRGRIFSPVGLGGKTGLVNLDQARVRVVGSSDWISTDSNGVFTLPIKKWFQNKRVDLEFSTANFFNHRYSVLVQGSEIFEDLYAFPAAYIRKLAQTIDLDLDPMNGIIFGKIKNKSVRVDALSDHSSQNFAKDFYFDFKGRLRGSHYMTDPRFGTFVIFNIPKGRSIINGSTKSGKLYFSDSASIAPSTISIVLD